VTAWADIIRTIKYTLKTTNNKKHTALVYWSFVS